MSKEKVVLAYSGGLDTTAIIPWLKENFDSVSYTHLDVYKRQSWICRIIFFQYDRK